MTLSAVTNSPTDCRAMFAPTVEPMARSDERYPYKFNKIKRSMGHAMPMIPATVSATNLPSTSCAYQVLRHLLNDL